MGRIWRIDIPIRPKAVQSVRVGKGGFFPDKKVREWKTAILPYIVKACNRKPPTEYPLRINVIRYKFKYPETTKKNIKEYIAAGGIVPYIGTCDITDNLAKGLVDTCAGHVFVNDKLIWHVGESEKVYAENDGIYIEFEETPDVMLITGKRADGNEPGSSGLF